MLLSLPVAFSANAGDAHAKADPAKKAAARKTCKAKNLKGKEFTDCVKAEASK